MDCKATVNIGDYSRGGKTRGDHQAADHDMGCQEKYTPFGLVDEDGGQLDLAFGSSAKTSDFIADSLYDVPVWGHCLANGNVLPSGHAVTRWASRGSARRSAAPVPLSRASNTAVERDGPKLRFGFPPRLRRSGRPSPPRYSK
jgi:hypothetical protein